MENRRNYKIIDAHCDTLSILLREGGSLADSSCCVSLSKLQAYGGYVQFFAAWVDDRCKTPLQQVLLLIDRFYNELEKHKDVLCQILDAEDIVRVFQQQKTGAMLTIENGNCLEGRLENLRLLHRLGVRALTLTWNGANALGDGIMEPSGGGLSEFGRAVVREMNRLGMAIDVSHLSEKGFWDVLALSEKPVMASHSNARSVSDCPRNLTDEQIRGLAQSGGIIGLNLYPAFLSDSTAGLADAVSHIEHILAVGGEDCIGLGSDFDGFSPPMAEGLTGPEDYIRLFSALEERGHDKKFINKLSGENFIRFLKEI